MIKPIGIQRKRQKGWRLPPNTISVARPGTWGNPHKVAGKITAFDAVAMFEDDLVNLRLTDRRGVPLLLRVHELRGKNLACFCKEGEICHRDVLLSYANGTLKDFPPIIWLLSDDKVTAEYSKENGGIQYAQVPSEDSKEARYVLAEALDVLALEWTMTPPDYLFIQKRKGKLVVS